jgi:DNA replication protein DnaC
MSNQANNCETLRPVPKLSEGQLDPLFRRLNLAHTRRIYQAAADRAEKENWSYRDFLGLVLAEEVAHRKQTRLQRLTRKARFPFLKTIEEFDFTLQTTLRQSLLGSYLGPDFITEGRSLILYGKAGRGKTHLAVAIGYRAIQNGFETFCTTAAELIENLSNASQRGQLQPALLTYTHPHVLVVDELGYLTYGSDAANVLFHVVNHRHLRKRPMIFTTNKPLNEWGKVLHDEDLAAAILDRVLERGRFIHLDGPSGRTRHLNLEQVLPTTVERARISGNRVPEFPEPTNPTRPTGDDLAVKAARRGSLTIQIKLAGERETNTATATSLVRRSHLPIRFSHCKARIRCDGGQPLTLGRNEYIEMWPVRQDGFGSGTVRP